MELIVEGYSLGLIGIGLFSCIFITMGMHMIVKKTEVCPSCKTELIKVGDKYQEPIAGSVIGGD